MLLSAHPPCSSPITATPCPPTDHSGLSVNVPSAAHPPHIMARSCFQQLLGICGFLPSTLDALQAPRPPFLFQSHSIIGLPFPGFTSSHRQSLSSSDLISHRVVLCTSMNAAKEATLNPNELTQFMVHGTQAWISRLQWAPVSPRSHGAMQRQTQAYTAHITNRCHR